MGKKIVAARELPAGHAIRREDLTVKCPGDGLPPHEIDKVVGRTTLEPLAVGADITWEALNGQSYKRRVIEPIQPHGLPTVAATMHATPWGHWKGKSI